MRKLFALAAAVVAALALSACTPEVTGYVVGKDHDPAHYETDTVPVYTQQCLPRTSTDFNGNMTTTVQCSQVFSHYNYVDRWVRDRYKIQVRDQESDKKHWLNISVGEYDALKLGDFYSNESERG